MVIHILMENLLKIIKQNYLMMYVKYVSMKENKNLLKLSVVIKYVWNVLNNFKNNKNMNYAHYVDNIIGMKK